MEYGDDRDYNRCNCQPAEKQLRKLAESLAPLTKQEKINYLTSQINALEEDCEAFGETPQDTLRLRILYKMRRAHEGTQTIEP